ncbi:MAG: enoyl-CoA hydratase-related protein [Acidimicrobiales bacterium]|jgi:enoyl-CoA hydratase|nr:enoyl-CoA hydratase-related protein [Acidimicrobiales bacterium]
MSTFEPIVRPEGHPLVRAEVVDGDVGIVTLADPERRNALRIELSLDLAAAVAELVDDGVGALVVTAEPPVFCAGGDIDDLVAPRAALRDTYAGFLALTGSPVVTVAAVGGACVGAGVNLPLACDVVIATPNARFDPRFLDVGIHPGGGHLRRLTDRIGRQGAAALALCGDTLDGRDAETKGLAWRCVDDDELLATAVRLARRAAGRDRELVARTRATLDASLTVGHDEALELELVAQQWSMDRPGFVDGVRALRDRLGRGDQRLS